VKPGTRFTRSEDALHAAAAQLAGSDDFGPPDYLEGLRVLLQALDEQAGLSDLGRRAAWQQLVGDLAGRAFSETGWQAHPQHTSVRIERPLFIIGLPRTGTTALQALLAADPRHQALELWLGESPMPRPPRTRWPDEPQFQRCDATHRAQYEAAPELLAMHEMHADKADECWHLLHQSFASVTYECTARIPSYSRWWASCDMRAAYVRYRRNLQLIGSTSPDARWVLKDASHLFAVDALLQSFPDACIVQTHRDPVKLIPSVCSLNAGFRRGLETRPDDAALGREQLELWARGIERSIDARSRHASAQFLDVHFQELLADPVATAERILVHFGATPGPAERAALRAWHADHAAGRHGAHAYSAEQFGLSETAIRERFADYVETFGVVPG
jgi:hypothetical protein